MDELLKNRLNQTADPTNYLKVAEQNGYSYLNDFIAVYETYLANFPTETEKWLKDKMLLNVHKFDEKQFIQFACEATIVKFFADKFKKDLAIEKKINPANNKDVDLVFSHEGITFNIEIKCSDFKQKEAIDSNNTLKIQTVGRMGDLEDLLKELRPVLNQVAEKMELDGVELAKNMDNNLKDFLKSANDKFNPAATEDDLNILSVSCNDAEDLQLWYYYMYRERGLFTKNSYHPKEEYQNVDVVVLNNLYFKHNKYDTKKLDNHWDLGNAFSLIFLNPFALKAKDKAVYKLLEILPNYNKELRTWEMPGEAEEHVKDSRRIADFIKAELEENQGIYLFLKP